MLRKAGLQDDDKDKDKDLAKICNKAQFNPTTKAECIEKILTTLDGKHHHSKAAADIMKSPLKHVWSLVCTPQEAKAIRV